MANIVWTDPPPTNRRGGLHPWAEIAEALRTKPGEWALVLRGIHSSYSSSINNGKIKAFQPAGAYEARAVATAERDGKKTHDLYIRFIGTNETAEDGNDA